MSRIKQKIKVEKKRSGIKAKVKPERKISGVKSGNKNEISYNGKTIKKIFPSGMYEFYSDAQDRFLKFDDLDDAKSTIDAESESMATGGDIKYNYNVGQEIQQMANDGSVMSEGIIIERKISRSKYGDMPTYTIMWGEKNGIVTYSYPQENELHPKRYKVKKDFQGTELIRKDIDKGWGVYVAIYRKNGDNEWRLGEILSSPDLSEKEALKSAQSQFINDNVAKLEYPRQVKELYEWKLYKLSDDNTKMNIGGSMEKGGISGTLSTTYSNPIEYLKAMGAKVYSDLNYSTETNGINYYVGYKGDKAIVVAFIEDENNYMITKDDAREMSLTAKTKEANTVELYTNYGIELHSKLEKPQDIGFNKIYKVSIGGSMAKGGRVSNNAHDVELIENAKDGKRWRGIVSKKTYNHLEDIQNQGGFRRFNIDLYDDTIESSSIDESTLKDYLKTLHVSYEKGGSMATGGKLSFTTHTGEIVSGKRLTDALNKVADDWAEIQRAIRRQDKYAPHVSEIRKEENLKKGLQYAEEIRRGEHINNFTIWQRLDTELTGETVPLLSKSSGGSMETGGKVGALTETRDGDTIVLKKGKKVYAEIIYNKNPDYKWVLFLNPKSKSGMALSGFESSEAAIKRANELNDEFNKTIKSFSTSMETGGIMDESDEMSEAETKLYIQNLSEEDWNRLKPENKKKYKKYRNSSTGLTKYKLYFKKLPSITIEANSEEDADEIYRTMTSEEAKKLGINSELYEGIEPETIQRMETGDKTKEDFKIGDKVKYYIGGYKDEDLAHYGTIQSLEGDYPNYDKRFARVSGLGDAVEKDKLIKVEEMATGGEVESKLCVGDIYHLPNLPQEKGSHYYTVIHQKTIGGGLYSYPSDEKGKPKAGGTIIHSNSWLGRTPVKVGHIDLEQVTRNIGGECYQYYKSGNKDTDIEMANLDARWKAFSKNATIAQRTKYDKQEDMNHHFENAKMITDWFDNHMEHGGQINYSKGGMVMIAEDDIYQVGDMQYKIIDISKNKIKYLTKWATEKEWDRRSEGSLSINNLAVKAIFNDKTRIHPTNKKSKKKK